MGVSWGASESCCRHNTARSLPSIELPSVGQTSAFEASDQTEGGGRDLCSSAVTSRAGPVWKRVHGQWGES